ncbi:MAG: monoheme cytochrome C [Bacteroidia bacterium]|nr:monoheme cytochrome C [Bacteroidia bacterium]
MTSKDHKPLSGSAEDRMLKHLGRLFGLVTVAFLLLLTGLVLIGNGVLTPGDPPLAAQEKADSDEPVIVDGMDITNGLIVADGYEVVKANCTGCHSGKLISQNRMTRERWLSSIRWMQETQKLWDLGGNEGPILDYLELNYAPEQFGRRMPLEVAEWYEI